jgi:hypothetical protein
LLDLGFEAAAADRPDDIDARDKHKIGQIGQENDGVGSDVRCYLIAV